MHWIQFSSRTIRQKDVDAGSRAKQDLYPGILGVCALDADLLYMSCTERGGSSTSFPPDYESMYANLCMADSQGPIQKVRQRGCIEGFSASCLTHKRESDLDSNETGKSAVGGVRQGWSGSC